MRTCKVAGKKKPPVKGGSFYPNLWGLEGGYPPYLVPLKVLETPTY